MEIKIGMKMSPRFSKDDIPFECCQPKPPFTSALCYMFLMESSWLGRPCLQRIYVIALHCHYK